jgi:pSer/pThr/pTyr-binding forkhead associated (FHA) protein
MRPKDDATGGTVWANGDLMFRVAGGDAKGDRIVEVDRPFARIGRSGDADIALDDRAVSTSHAYLHLDRRGVFTVDLLTRTGLRINGVTRPVGWLRPGDWLEIADRKIELIRARIDGVTLDPHSHLCQADPLADVGPGRALASVTLEPRRSGDAPWVIGSELVFLGWSASCGIQVKDAAIARTHCVLVRTARGAHLVDLCGRQTWVEGRPVEAVVVLRDGDLLTLGSTQFTVRVEPPARAPLHVHIPEVVPRDEAATLPARRDPLLGPAFEQALASVPAPMPLALSPDLIPVEAQNALLAWMMGTIQGGQGEMLRRQGEFQLAMTELLRQLQTDSTSVLQAHLERIESIDRELASLRAAIEGRDAAPPPPDRVLPTVPPLRIARPARPEGPPGDEAKATAAWLLQRVNQLEDENRSAWKDLLARISQTRRAT